MPPKLRRSRQRELPKSIVLILQTGRDFFSDLDGTISENTSLLEAAWADVEIRQKVIERHAAKHPEGGQPWAARKFGIGK